MVRHMVTRLSLDDETVAAFCRKHGIGRLALFGSVSLGRERADSDIDLLVEFIPGRVPGLIRLAAMELEFSELVGGRDVELRTYEDLSPDFRDEVRSNAIPLYEAA